MSDRRRLLLFAALALGLIFRLSLTLTTFGTDDVRYKSLWGELARRYGIAHAYAHAPQLNDPPLGVAQMTLALNGADAAGVAFGDLFRLMQVAADVVSFACLIAIGRRTGVGEWIAPLYFLAPPAILISGFHGNGDPTMLALVLVATLLVTRWPALAGVALAAAAAVKVVPLLLAPLFFFAARRGRWRFAIGFGAAIALSFGVPALIGGRAVLRNTLLYRGLGNWWGIVSILTLAGRGSAWLPRVLASVRAVDPFVIVALVLAIAEWLRRRLDDNPDDARDLRLVLAASGMVFTMLLVAGTGFGVQYLLWPMPFLPFFTRTPLRIAVLAAVSVFLVAVYTSWAGGFPWWFASSTRPGGTTDALVMGGWVVWGVLGAALSVYTFSRGGSKDPSEGR